MPEQGPDPAARPKILRRSLPLASDAPDLVPARMIDEALYCERLLYLEWAQGEFDDNYFTVDGRSVHARADRPGGKPLPPAKKASKRNRKQLDPTAENAGSMN